MAGYTVFPGAPTAEQTALALHQAAGRKTATAWPMTGPPDVLYSDHGSDFTSSRLERVCLDTHIHVIHSRVSVPQGRGKIERFFGTITPELLPHLPGHIPHGTRGQPVTAPALTLEQLDGILERFVVDPHRETGQPPVERWLGDGWIPRAPTHPEDLDLLLLTAATGRIVQRDDIRFARTRHLSPVLADYVDENVTVSTTRATPPSCGSTTTTSTCAGRSPPSSPTTPSLSSSCRTPVPHSARPSSSSCGNGAASPTHYPPTTATCHRPRSDANSAVRHVDPSGGRPATSTPAADYATD